VLRRTRRRNEKSRVIELLFDSFLQPVSKLKQASAVLQIEPKELQNLVQFGVVQPQRLVGTYFFDTNTLMVAKVTFCPKESLGTRTSVLSKLMEVFLASEKEFKSDNPKYIVFKCRLAAEENPKRSACRSAHSENSSKSK
jgi:hypothetical protein